MYSLVIADSQNLLAKVTVTLSTGQNVQFKKQGSYWIGLARLTKGKNYSYFFGTGSCKINDSFAAGISRTIELFDYNPPAQQTAVSFVFSDFKNMYSSIQVKGDYDPFGNPAKTLSSTVKAEHKNGVFYHTLVLESGKTFNICVSGTQDTGNSIESVFKIPVPHTDSSYEFICTPNGIYKTRRYTLVIEDSGKKLNSLFLDFKSEYHTKQRVEFIRNDDFLIAELNLLQGIQYTYSVITAQYQLNRSFEPGGEKTCVLFEYNPPENMRSITIQIHDPENMHKNLYICGNYDEWGNKSDSYSELHTLTKDSKGFLFRKIVSSQDEFMLALFLEPVINNEKRLKLITVLPDCNEYYFVCLADKIVQEHEYTLKIHDSRSLLPEFSFELMVPYQKNISAVFKRSGQYLICQTVLAEGMQYSYTLNAGQYKVCDSFYTKDSTDIELFSYNPPEHIQNTIITIDDPKNKYNNLYICGTFDRWGNYADSYSSSVPMEKAKDSFSYSVSLDKTGEFSFLVCKSPRFTSSEPVGEIIAEKNVQKYHFLCIEHALVQKKQYELTIGNPLNVSGSFFGTISSEYEHAELIFKKRKNCFAAQLWLAAGIRYTYRIMKENSSVSGEITPKENRTNELTVYAPPAQTRTLTIQIKDPDNLYDSLYITGNHDWLGNRTDHFNSLKKLIRANNAFLYTVILDAGQTFDFAVFETSDMNKKAGVLISGAEESMVSYRVTRNGLVKEREYELIVKDLHNKLSDLEIVFESEAGNQTVTLKKIGNSVKGTAFLAEGIPVLYKVQAGDYRICDSLNPGLKNTIVLFEYMPPEHTLQTTIEIADPKNYFESLYICGTYDWWGNTSESYSELTELKAADRIFRFDAILQEGKRYTFAVFTVPERAEENRIGILNIVSEGAHHRFLYTKNGLHTEREYVFSAFDSKEKIDFINAVISADVCESENIILNRSDSIYTGIIYLYDGVLYTCTIQTNRFSVEKTIIPGEKKNITLFSYNPPESLTRIALSADDRYLKKYRNLYYTTTVDFSGNFSEEYAAPQAMQYDNGVFYSFFSAEQGHTYYISFFEDSSEITPENAVAVAEVNADSTDKECSVYIGKPPVFIEENSLTAAETGLHTVGYAMMLWLIIQVITIVKGAKSSELTHEQYPVSNIPTLAVLGYVCIAPLIPAVYRILSSQATLYIDEKMWFFSAFHYVSPGAALVYAITGIPVCLYTLHNKRTAFFPRFRPVLAAVMIVPLLVGFMCIYHHGDHGFGETIRQPLANFIIRTGIDTAQFITGLPEHRLFGFISVCAGFLTILIMFILFDEQFKTNNHKWFAAILFLTGYGYMQLFFGHLETSGISCLAAAVFFVSAVRSLCSESPGFKPAVSFAVMCCVHVSLCSYVPAFLTFLWLKKRKNVFYTALVLCAAAGMWVIIQYNDLLDFSVLSVMTRLMEVLGCLFFIAPLAVSVLFFCLVVKPLKPGLHSLQNPGFMFAVSMTLSFASAMIFARASYSFDNFHTFASVGIFLSFLVAKIAADKNYLPILPLMLMFVPQGIMVMQHAGWYPYGAPPYAYYEEYSGWCKPVPNSQLAGNLKTLVHALDKGKPEGFAGSYLYTRYGKQVFKGFTDIYSFFEKREQFIHTRLEPEYFTRYRNTGRYDPQIFITALNSPIEHEVSYALHLLSLMDHTEPGIKEAVAPFVNSGIVTQRTAAEEILKKPDQSL